MVRKNESGQIVIVVSIFIAISMVITLALFQKSKMQYDVAQVIKQTANTYSLAEASAVQCNKSVNMLIESKMPTILNTIKLEVVKKGIDYCGLKLGDNMKEGLKIDTELLKANTLEKILNEVNWYYFESLGGSEQVNFFKPIDMHYDIYLENGEMGYVTTVYPRIYTAECSGAIPKEDRILKEAVKALVTEKELREYAALREKALQEELTDVQKQRLERLHKKALENNQIVIQVTIETKNSKGKIFNKERILAGAKLNFSKALAYTLEETYEWNQVEDENLNEHLKTVSNFQKLAEIIQQPDSDNSIEVDSNDEAMEVANFHIIPYKDTPTIIRTMENQGYYTGIILSESPVIIEENIQVEGLIVAPEILVKQGSKIINNKDVLWNIPLSNLEHKRVLLDFLGLTQYERQNKMDSNIITEDKMTWLRLSPKSNLVVENAGIQSSIEWLQSTK